MKQNMVSKLCVSVGNLEIRHDLYNERTSSVKFSIIFVVGFTYQVTTVTSSFFYL